MDVDRLFMKYPEAGEKYPSGISLYMFIAYSIHNEEDIFYNSYIGIVTDSNDTPCCIDPCKTSSILHVHV